MLRQIVRSSTLKLIPGRVILNTVFLFGHNFLFGYFVRPKPKMFNFGHSDVRPSFQALITCTVPATTLATML